MNLDPEFVSQARREETVYFRDRCVYEKVDLAECWAVTGKGPIAT